MNTPTFAGPDGRPVTAVTAEEMRAIDRVAVAEVGLDLPRMMEHAGRGLAAVILRARQGDLPVTVLAGNGGNGGGLACARHVANRGVSVRVVLDRPRTEIDGVTGEQLRILEAMDVPVGSVEDGPAFDTDVALAGLVVDALIGYGLTGAPRGAAAELIEAAGNVAETIVSLDIPSGTNATTGETPGPAVEPDCTVTLALPKTGLEAITGDLFLADISIPSTVYSRLDIAYVRPFGDRFVVPLSR